MLRATFRESSKFAEELEEVVSSNSAPSDLSIANRANFPLSKESGNGSNLEDFMDLTEFKTEHRLWNLTDQERNIFISWLTYGVRNNSSAWFLAAKTAYSNFAKADRLRSLSTLLYIDIFNRADEVFDEFRELFLDKKSGLIDTSTIFDVPVLPTEQGVASVRDLLNILYKIVTNCGSYSSAESNLIKWHIEHFLSVSTSAQHNFEHKKRYSLDEALALRWLTVGPMTDTIGSLYALSPAELAGGESESNAFHQNKLFLETIIAWQLIDDFYDVEGDFQKNNMNLIIGIIIDCGEPLPPFPTVSYDIFDPYYDNDEETVAFNFTHPKSTVQIQLLFNSLTSNLEGDIRRFIFSRVPRFIYES